MKIEEIENKIKELQAQLEELKNPKTAYGDLVAGDTFMFKGHEFTKLRDGRAIINDYNEDFMSCPFDNIDNNYKHSLIASYIHGSRYFSLLGIVCNDLINCDVTDVELLSVEEYRENEDLIKDFECDWWTCSGSTNYCDFAMCVAAAGGFTSQGVYLSTTRGVRPAFHFANDIKVRVVNEQ